MDTTSRLQFNTNVNVRELTPTLQWHEPLPMHHGTVHSGPKLKEFKSTYEEHISWNVIFNHASNRMYMIFKNKCHHIIAHGICNGSSSSK